MAGAATTRTSFAPATLLAVAVRALRAIDRDLVPADAAEPDWLASAHVGKDEKRRVLGHALARGGPAPILLAGTRVGRLADRPVIEILLRSPDPAVLADKWTRLEAYYHSDHRTEIDTTAEDAWTCRHVSITDTPPAPAEDLLICGVQIGLLEALGVADVACDIGWKTLYRWGRIQDLIEVPPRTDRWQISWQPGSATPPPVPADSAAGNVAQRVAALFAADIARNWKLGDAAGALKLSARSLQRALNGEGSSFSGMVRQARVRAACRHLRDDALSLAEIGYACGYSDQAHFHRDFRRVMAMTPTAWRDLEAGG